MGIGSLSLTPSFSPTKTEYTTSTTNASNKVTATPTNAEAELVLTVNGEPIDSGDSAVWKAGINTVSAKVKETVSGQEVEKTYTVTVTKN